jgi:tRNA(Ile)-lysidine synthase
LQHTAERLGARFVAVAHTADDQVETVLHRILRGTGITGLAGMHRVRPLSSSVALVRPLLAFRRQEVLEYLATIAQDFRTDSTNDDIKYTRNRLRHELLPALRQHFNHDVDAALLRLSAQAAEAQEIIHDAAVRLLAECRVGMELPSGANTPGARRVRIHCDSLAREPELIIREVCRVAWSDAVWPLQEMGFDEWQQLASIVRETRPHSVLNLPGGVRAHRDEATLVLERTGLS